MTSLFYAITLLTKQQLSTNKPNIDLCSPTLILAITKKKKHNKRHYLKITKQGSSVTLLWLPKQNIICHFSFQKNHFLKKWPEIPFLYKRAIHIPKKKKNGIQIMAAENNAWDPLTFDLKASALQNGQKDNNSTPLFRPFSFFFFHFLSFSQETGRPSSEQGRCALETPSQCSSIATQFQFTYRPKRGFKNKKWCCCHLGSIPFQTKWYIL